MPLPAASGRLGVVSPRTVCTRGREHVGRITTTGAGHTGAVVRVPSEVVNSRVERGLRAATGRRHRLRAHVRSAAIRRLRRLDERLRRPGDYLEFLPGSTDPAVLSDLAARINWYLGGATVPIYIEGASGVEIDPKYAPHMAPDLVRDPGWAARRPAGRPELVIHDLRPLTLPRYAATSRHVTFASPWFAWEAERGWTDLQRRFDAMPATSGGAAADRLSALARPGQSAFVLGTGPSAADVDPALVDTDIRVICNSTVANVDLLRSLRPDIIAFSDPVFHCGPSRYAAAFRADLQNALRETEAVFLTGDRWSGALLARCPDIAERTAVVKMEDSAEWKWPTRGDFAVRTTANVLTLLMLPAAFALADQVEIAGCDGRQPSETYFWKHNPATQYSDDTMAAAFAAHPAFFADRDYADYYDHHCRELEEFFEVAESHQKNIVSVTRSYIPALVARSELGRAIGPPASVDFT